MNAASPSGRGQTAKSIAQNITFFGVRGDTYKSRLQQLDTYAVIRASTNEALHGIDRLLDVGSGGTFDYDVTIPHSIDALDLFFDASAAQTQGDVDSRVSYKRGSALEIPEPDGSYDGVLMSMLLHHLVGHSAEESLANVRRALQEGLRVLRPGGRLVIVESCVPAWFYAFERLVFRSASALATRLIAHPPALQYPAHVLADLVGHAGGKVVVTRIPHGRWLLQFGFVYPAALTPARPYRIIVEKAPAAVASSAP
jgi:SAM-dependent methyltransferase